MLTGKTKTERDDAFSIRTKLENFETVFLIVLETKKLLIVDQVSKMLQNKSQNIEEATKLFNTALMQMNILRTQFSEIKSVATDLTKKWSAKTEFSFKRISRPRHYFDEIRNQHVFQTNEEIFKINVFFFKI